MRLRLWRLRYSWLWPRRPRDTYPRAGRRGWIRWTHSAWSEGGGGTDDRLSSSVAQKGWQGDRRQKAIVCPTVRAPLGWQAEACPTHAAQPSRNGQTPGGALCHLKTPGRRRGRRWWPWRRTPATPSKPNAG